MSLLFIDLLLFKSAILNKTCCITIFLNNAIKSLKVWLTINNAYATVVKQYSKSQVTCTINKTLPADFSICTAVWVHLLCSCCLEISYWFLVPQESIEWVVLSRYIIASVIRQILKKTIVFHPYIFPWFIVKLSSFKSSWTLLMCPGLWNLIGMKMVSLLKKSKCSDFRFVT